MKGIVFINFLESVEREFGKETSRELIKNSPLPSGGSYSPAGDYAVLEMKLLFFQLSAVSDLPHWKILQRFGGELFHELFRQYPGFLKDEELMPVISTTERKSNDQTGEEPLQTHDAKLSEEQWQGAVNKLFYIFEKEPSNVMSVDWPDTLDVKVVDRLFHGDLEHLQLVFNVFAEETPKELSRINNALDSKDWTLLGKIAHKIKPGFVMVGRKDIRDILEQIEEKCGEQHPDADSLKVMISRFRQETLRTTEGVTKVLEQLSNILKH